MTPYQCDDPEIERELATLEWTDLGFPASLPLALFTHYERQGVDELDACRLVVGQLAGAVDPSFSMMTARAAGGDEAAAREHVHLRWLTDLLLEHVTDEQLEAIQRAERDRRREPPEIDRRILPPD
jgi:hypothetical protein